MPPSSIPDHSILSGTFHTSFFPSAVKQVGQITESVAANLPRKEKKNLKRITESFFMSQETRNAVLATVDRIENSVNVRKILIRFGETFRNCF